jgi:Rhodopirellula transposase DDE domain
MLGGSNGHRTRLCKVELQKLARDTGLLLTVAHSPPGTSKATKVEARARTCDGFTPPP